MGECALASRTGVGAICRPLTNELGRGCRRNLGSSLQPLLYPTNRFTHPAYEHAAAEEDPFRSEPQPWCERRCRSRKCCGAVRFDDCCAFRTFGESPEALKNRSPLAGFHGSLAQSAPDYAAVASAVRLGSTLDGLKIPPTIPQPRDLNAAGRRRDR